MSSKKKFKVTINQKPYTIVGDKSDAHMNAVVEIVNRQLNQLNDIAPELSVSDRSILMAVNAISDQLVKEQKIIELEEEIKSLKRSQSSRGRAKR